MSIVRISNQLLWAHAYEKKNIDDWLKEHVGVENYLEDYGNMSSAVPFRAFEFYDDQYATLFSLKWL